ncbi:cadmium-translocating P-type ATPase [Enterobacter sp. 10-1]|uniref:heavy metal translocating P-type ATPase n=1 Tax=Raoultella sp. 10-1 TaxID=2683201 RepID=UPI000BA4591B|nr:MULTISPECIES: cation-translocating P-type ATPase [Enterobacteriaceae]MVT03959.1 cadmium-translocating P-type ATPase [Raoultella sp. 10-1]PAC11570.1 cadmium-translocating P-type ATPase [Enterobacter sp. 10-1]
MSQSCSHGHIHFSSHLQTPAEQRRMARRLTLAMITIGLLLLSLLWRAVAPDQPAIGDILAAVAWLLVAVPVFRAGWHSLLHPDLHGVTDLLIVLAMLGAWALGDLMTAALLPVIMIFGHILEERSVMGTRQAIAGLSKLAHSRARRLRQDGALENIGSQQLRPGDVVEVRPGDQIPADGKILSGNASLDVASITGESVPAEVCPGMSVFGGTLNLNGLLRVEITHTGEHSTLGKVLALMQDAERAKPPITRMLERYAGHYLILVLLIAATTWFLTYDSQAMLAVLVAACPCALVLSAPATSMAGIAVAARHGILIRNAAFLEELADVDAVIIDKTGTLTQGRLRLVDVVPATSRPRESLLQLASALGAASNHPVSRAMVGALPTDEEIPLRDVEEIQGLGVVATTDAGRALLGRRELFDRYQIDVAPLPDHDGPTVGIAEGGVFLGWLLLDDTIRPEAPEAIEMLQNLGIGRFLLLTGDRLAVAQRVAQRTGIGELAAEVLPAEKLQQVQRAVSEGWRPMVVGDGINDALALKAGAVGIAMGSNGADIALASADVVLTGSDLRRLPLAVRLSRQCRATLRVNVFIGLGWTILIVIAAAMGLLGAAGALVAAILHNLSTLLVLLNTGRLLQFDARRGKDENAGNEPRS